MEYNKKFLIIGNKNAITYKETFKLIKENKLWLGYRNINSDMWFLMPDNTEKYEKLINGKKAKHIMACWYTNLDVAKRHEKFDMYKKYKPEEYPKYDNYNAINVNVVAEIPANYDGAMGVPITFLDKYNPEQFEIMGLGNSRDNFTPDKDYVNPYKIMRDGTRKNGNAINCVLAIEVQVKPNKIHYTSENSEFLIAPYARVIIKNRKV